MLMSAYTKISLLAPSMILTIWAIIIYVDDGIDKNRAVMFLVILATAFINEEIARHSYRLNILRKNKNS